MLEQLIKEGLLPIIELRVGVEPAMTERRQIGNSGQTNSLPFSSPYLKLPAIIVSYFHLILIMPTAEPSDKPEIRIAIGSDGCVTNAITEVSHRSSLGSYDLTSSSTLQNIIEFGLFWKGELPRARS